MKCQQCYYRVEIEWLGKWVDYPILGDIAQSKELTLDLISRIKPTRPFGWCTDWIRIAEPE